MGEAMVCLWLHDSAGSSEVSRPTWLTASKDFLPRIKKEHHQICLFQCPYPIGPYFKVIIISTKLGVFFPLGEKFLNGLKQGTAGGFNKEVEELM